MVSKLNKCLYLTTSIILALSMISCDKEELDPLKIFFTIESDTNLIDAFYTANGETLQFSLNLNRNESTPGISIEQIEVFINNIKIAENYNSEHLDVSYQLKNETVGKNPLRITVIAAAPGYKETIVHTNMGVSVFTEKPIYGYELVTDDLWVRGSTVSLSVKEVDSATLHISSTEVTYDIDNDVIGQTDSSDDVFTYKIDGLSPGSHNLSATITGTIPEDNFSCNLVITKTITVQ